VAGVCCYCWFLFAPLVGGRLDRTRAFVSELAVRGSPGSGWFRAADVVAGVLIVVLAVGVWEWLRRPAGWGMAGPVLVGTVGAASIVDGVSPMACAPSVDPVCARIEQSRSLLGQLTDLHTVSGVVGMIAAAAAMVLVGRRARHGLSGRGLWWFGVACGAAVLLLGSALSASALFDGPGVGTLERAQLLIVASWLGAVSAMLIRGSGALRSSPQVTAGRRAGARRPFVVSRRLEPGKSGSGVEWRGFRGSRNGALPGSSPRSRPTVHGRSSDAARSRGPRNAPRIRPD
jgi:hypothetical protein